MSVFSYRVHVVVNDLLYSEVTVDLDFSEVSVF